MFLPYAGLRHVMVDSGHHLFLLTSLVAHYLSQFSWLGLVNLQDSVCIPRNIDCTPEVDCFIIWHSFIIYFLTVWYIMYRWGRSGVAVNKMEVNMSRQMITNLNSFWTSTTGPWKPMGGTYDGGMKLLTTLVFSGWHCPFVLGLSLLLYYHSEHDKNEALVI